MSDSATRIAAIMAVKANSRLVLATELVARNAECEALRARPVGVSAEDHVAAIDALVAEIAELKRLVGVHKTEAAALRNKPSPRRDWAAENKARHARNRAMTAAYFAAFPGERSCTPYQLEQFAAMQQ